jgi:L-ribulose-5-phosphate 4-epimerase
MTNRYRHLKEEAFAANVQIPKKDLAIYTFGNVSAFDAALGVFAIKPSGVPYDELKVEHMVVVDLDNTIVEGKLNPSSDTNTHSVLYREFPGIGGITHTHSTCATGWAQAQRDIPLYGTTHADHLAEAVPCTEVMSDELIAGNYETATGQQIVECFRSAGLSHMEVEMVLVACHGPFTWGENAEKSLYNSAVLEELAKMALYTEQVNMKALPMKQALIDKHYQRKHGTNAYYGQQKK